MKINAANVAWHKFFCGKPSFVDKKNGSQKNGCEKNKFGKLSTKDVLEITDNAVPVKRERS